jgi:hypothetical protein
MPNCHTSETVYLSLQVNITCLLLALVGVMMIVEHPTWLVAIPTERTIIAGLGNVGAHVIASLVVG